VQITGILASLLSDARLNTLIASSCTN